jgi:putative ABC transport system permease protein
MEDYKRYSELAKLPLATAPTMWSRQTVKHEDKAVEFLNVQGTTHDYIRTTNLVFDQGRFFNELESNGGRNVVVLGSEVASKLFPLKNGMDNTVKIKGKKFKVVGVLEEQGSWVMGSWNPDNQIFVPIETIFKYFQRESFRSITFNVRAPNSQMVDAVKEEAIGIMRRVRGLSHDERNDFSINQQDGLLENIDQTIGVIQIAGIFITGLSLFVGAIGIMNKIGIRKAIGAKKRTILGQFISESAIICLLGGLIGLIIAIITSFIIDQFLPTSVQIDVVFLALIISILTGIISGFAPAYTASKMDPVEALRYE